MRFLQIHIKPSRRKGTRITVTSKKLKRTVFEQPFERNSQSPSQNGEKVKPEQEHVKHHTVDELPFNLGGWF